MIAMRIAASFDRSDPPGEAYGVRFSHALEPPTPGRHQVEGLDIRGDVEYL
jgi:hypothetical protein